MSDEVKKGFQINSKKRVIQVPLSKYEVFFKGDLLNSLLKKTPLCSLRAAKLDYYLNLIEFMLIKQFASLGFALLSLRVDLQNGKQFTVLTKGASVTNKDIQSAKFNRKPLNKPTFTHTAHSR